MKLSVYGATGFVGSKFKYMYPSHLTIKREDRKPLSKDILYLISTVDNYNIFDQITLDVDSNLKILCEVLQHCKDKNMTINYISSWIVYGKTVPIPAIENATCFPKGFYSITKKCAEDLLISFCQTFNVSYRIIRLCNVLGTGDKGCSRKKNAITWMINRLREGLDIELYENGEIIRDFLHVEDACEAIELICSQSPKNQIYNVGGGKPIKIKTIFNLAKNKIKSSSKINSIKSPEFHQLIQPKDFWMDTTKLNSLGFNQKYNLEEIINSLCC
tara:strand:+ start:1776 stop:2594 length:819 start_codon:yes stop_codon:yes gene_type:complete